MSAEWHDQECLSQPWRKNASHWPLQILKGNARLVSPAESLSAPARTAGFGRCYVLRIIVRYMIPRPAFWEHMNTLECRNLDLYFRTGRKGMETILEYIAIIGPHKDGLEMDGPASVHECKTSWQHGDSDLSQALPPFDIIELSRKARAIADIADGGRKALVKTCWVSDDFQILADSKVEFFEKSMYIVGSSVIGPEAIILRPFSCNLMFLLWWYMKLI